MRQTIVQKGVEAGILQWLGPRLEAGIPGAGILQWFGPRLEAGIPGAGILQWFGPRLEAGIPGAGILQWLGPKLEAGTEEEGGRQLPARRDRKGVMGDIRTPQMRQPITPRRPERSHYELRRQPGRLRGQLEHARRQVVT